MFLRKTTNSSGLAVLAYNIPVNDDFTYSGRFSVKDESKLLAVNTVSNQIPLGQKAATEVIKLSKTIEMDSLVPFKIRIKSSKYNIDTYTIRFLAKRSDTDGVIERIFSISGINRTSSPLDTIITANVYSKSTFYITGSFKNGSTLITEIDDKIERNIDRNVVFLKEIQ
jgi:hypothetical protein